MDNNSLEGLYRVVRREDESRRYYHLTSFSKEYFEGFLRGVFDLPQKIEEYISDIEVYYLSPLEYHAIRSEKIGSINPRSAAFQDKNTIYINTDIFDRLPFVNKLEILFHEYFHYLQELFGVKYPKEIKEGEAVYFAVMMTNSLVMMITNSLADKYESIFCDIYLDYASYYLNAIRGGLKDTIQHLKENL